MNNFILGDIPQCRRQFTAMKPHNFLTLVTVVITDAAPDDFIVQIHNIHGVAPAESPLNRLNAGGQQTFTVEQHRLGGALINLKNSGALGEKTNPTFFGVHGAFR